MLQHIDINKIIFLDIETVPLEYEFKNLPKRAIDLWDKKTKYIQRYQEIDAEQAYSKAGIYAEFGKIVCISAGYVTQEKKEQKLRIKSIFGKDEKKLLRGFNSLLNKTLKENYLLCAHNGKEFDFPFIGRRNLINGLTLPAQLDIAGKKPWEIPHLDTMELWKFGDYKHFTSLKLLANILGIPSPKEDIDGSMVRQVYYEEKNLDRIITYCELDVVTTAQVFLKLRGEELLNESEIKNI